VIERERGNFILNEPQIFSHSGAMAKNFGEVQNEIYRSQLERSEMPHSSVRLTEFPTRSKEI
jgi:hypothetical protein